MADPVDHDPGESGTTPERPDDFDAPQRPYTDSDYTQGAYRDGYTGERMRRDAEFPGEYAESPGRKYDYDFGYGNRYRREYMRNQRDQSPQYGPGDEMPRRHRRPRRGRMNWRREAPPASRYQEGPRYPRGPHSGKGPAGYQRADERILEDVCERLTAHGWVDAGEVEVDVTNGIVTLRGEIADRRQKRMAEDSAYDVRGVHDVQNRLTIRRPGSESQEVGES